jgi:hypothetical protein
VFGKRSPSPDSSAAAAVAERPQQASRPASPPPAPPAAPPQGGRAPFPSAGLGAPILGAPTPGRSTAGPGGPLQQVPTAVDLRRSDTYYETKGAVRAFPDALDLLLICIESGMSVEAAFQKVSDEVGTQSVELAEEFTLTTAELSYLPDRRQAYDNLAQRVGLEGVKAVCLALQQAERYGTPLGTTMRVLAQENRDMRMSEAEKKAAALPPKLTVPMILFFLPVLFVVILGPAAIKVMAIQ